MGYVHIKLALGTKDVGSICDIDDGGELAEHAASELIIHIRVPSMEAHSEKAIDWAQLNCRKTDQACKVRITLRDV